MSERFRTGKGILEEGYPSETIIDNKTGKIYYKGYAYYKSSKEICELLNKFNDENKQLKNRLKFFNELNKPYGVIIKENEQLKSKVEYLERKIDKERIAYCQKQHEKWKNESITENEKIKQQRDFYYARLQKIIKIANGDLEND